jgi:hypothetical protein
VLSRLCLALATAGFALAALAHLASFAPSVGLYDERAFAAVVGLLTAGLVLPLGAMLVRLARAAPFVPWRGRVGFYDFRPALALLPPAMRALALGVLLYAGANFLGGILLIGPVKSAHQDGGRYYVTDAAGQTHEAAREEYLEYWALSARLATGHLLAFYLLPLVYFRWVDARRRELGADTPTPAGG